MLRDVAEELAGWRSRAWKAPALASTISCNDLRFWKSKRVITAATSDGEETCRPGDDRRGRVHCPLRSFARVYARSRRLRGSSVEEGPQSRTVGRDAEGRNSGGARYYERVVSGEADGAGTGGAAGSRRRRSREDA